jgi:hypothetical protein
VRSKTLQALGEDTLLAQTAANHRQQSSEPLIYNFHPTKSDFEFSFVFEVLKRPEFLVIIIIIILTRLRPRGLLRLWALRKEFRPLGWQRRIWNEHGSSVGSVIFHKFHDWLCILFHEYF